MEIWKCLTILSVTTLLILVGSKVIYKDDYAVITGTIVMPEANAEVLGGSTDINYPSGFNNSNCVIISLTSHNSLHPDWWCTRTSPGGVGYVSGSQDLRAALKSSNITVWSTKSEAMQSRNDVTFKIVLMKI